MYWQICRQHESKTSIFHSPNLGEKIKKQSYATNLFLSSLSLHFPQVNKILQAIAHLSQSCSLSPFSTCSTHLNSSAMTQTSRCTEMSTVHVLAPNFPPAPWKPPVSECQCFSPIHCFMFQENQRKA